MRNFPQEIDLQNSAHLLFEVGSVMTTLFGVLFLLTLLIVGLLFWLGMEVQLGLIVTGIFALLAIDGVIALFLSTNINL